MKVPYFNEIFQFIEKLFLPENHNLFNFIYFAIHEICTLLEINTEIIISSKLCIDHNLKSHDKVLGICQYLKTDIYINAIGGKSLHDKDVFKEHNIEFHFIKTLGNIRYKQFNTRFISNLSIIDVMMFNSPEKIDKMLNEYKLV